MRKTVQAAVLTAFFLAFGVLTAPAQTYELEADSSELAPESGETDTQCLVQRSNGELVFFNSNDGGIFSWDGSALTEERSSGNLNDDISNESNTIDRCDGVAMDTSDNAYFLLRSNGSSSENSWPTYVYKLPVSDSASVLASGDGLQSVAHNSGTVYLAGVEFRGASEDGVYSISDTGEDQSLETVVQDAELDLDYGMDTDEDGNIYAFSGEFAEGDRVRKIVRVADPSGSASLEEFVDPYQDGSPLFADSGDDIQDVDIVTYEGNEYIVVYNGSFEAENGDQWATIQVSDQSIDLLFDRSDLVDGLSVDDYVSGFTEPMAVNSDGEIFVASRAASFGGAHYIANVSDAPPLPVELATFDATRSGSNVELTWRTASETNNAGFRVQRQSESGSWTELDFVDSKASGGTTVEAQTYRYTVDRTLDPGTHRFRLEQVDLDGSTTIAGVTEVEVGMEEAVRLGQPAPNPVSGQTTVEVATKEATDMRVSVFNVLGQKVASLYDGTSQAGEAKTLTFDTSDLPSGVYFVRMQADGQTQTQRLTVVK